MSEIVQLILQSTNFKRLTNVGLQNICSFMY